jgi:hypothetical protein
MPLGPGGLDSNGIWLYGEDDSEALASDLLNIGMQSVSDVIGAGFGKVLQVESAILNVVASTTSTTYVDVPDLTITLTPEKEDSKFLIAVHVSGSNLTSGQSSPIQLVRDNGTVTPIAGRASGDQNFADFWGFSDATILSSGGVVFLDSPPTPLPATINYRVRFKADTGTAALNRYRNNATLRSTSTLVVYEIGA